MTEKVRLDQLLVQRGLVPSRTRAQVAISEGNVSVNGEVQSRAGLRLHPDVTIEIDEAHDFVSRGYLKLERALDEFCIDVRQRVVLDVGASTGGFTQLLLRRGAHLVFAVDVGSNQLHPVLRDDARVVSLEGVNIRAMEGEHLHTQPTLVVIDVSFISLKLVLPAIARLMKVGGDAIALVKPQFEVGRGNVGKRGIVRDPKLWDQAVHDVIHAAHDEGFTFVAQCDSPILGSDGNREFLIHLRIQATQLIDRV